MKLLVSSLCLALLASIALPTASDAQEVGVITAYNTNATSVTRSGQRAVVRLGKSVFYDQTFTTDANGRIQARLLDGSSFTLSANSSLTIDSFVYDPAESTGEIIANVAEGVVQFIGGELSKSAGQVTIETRIASIGIRGGIAIIRLSEDREDYEFSFHFGDGLDITLRNGRQYRLRRPGTSLQIRSTRAGAIRSARVGKMSSRQLGSVKALKGKIQNKNLSNQRKAILKQQIQQHGVASGLSSVLSSALASGVTSPKVGKAIKRLASKKRTNRARKVKRRMMRRRRKFN